jgi:16S rRNA (guanine966-N2)-methyltransferase
MRIIAGMFRQRAIVAPKSGETRPTSSMVREALFNICQSYIENVDFLDVYAGSGAMGLEALSRGARSATFIEKHPGAIKAIRQNIELLGVQDRALLLTGDAVQSLMRLSRMSKQYQIIYADPPYDAHNAVQEVLMLLNREKLLAQGGDLFIEESLKAPELDLHLEALQLQNSRKYGRSRLSHFVERCT